MSVPIVAIAGISGKMGRLVTRSLRQNHPNIKIHGLARSPDKVASEVRDHPNVTIFGASSTDKAALRRGLQGAAVCVCCYLGDDEFMIEGQKTLIDACIDEHVARYIASDYALDFRGLQLGQLPSKDPMKHIQAYLEDKEAKGEIKAVHVLNGGFIEYILGPYSPQFDPNTNSFRYFGTGDEKLDMTTYADAAAFTAEVAADPSAVGFLNGELVHCKYTTID